MLILAHEPGIGNGEYTGMKPLFIAFEAGTFTAVVSTSSSSASCSSSGRLSEDAVSADWKNCEILLLLGDILTFSGEGIVPDKEVSFPGPSFR